MEHDGKFLNNFRYGYQNAPYLLCLTSAEGGGGGERRPVDLLASPQVKRRKIGNVLNSDHCEGDFHQ